tara:strand:+ start:3407 stop:4069 length:663 start_codon:yes stop_codon:yes gene_type:complete
MIKLSEILTLDKLTYSNDIPKKHRNKMVDKAGLFKDLDVSQFKASPPPKNSSSQTMKEMISLDRINMPANIIKKADDIHAYYSEFFKSVGKEYPKKEVDVLMNDTKPMIYQLKYHYNRPRPYQVAKALDLRFYNKPLETAKTPSYPSGHSIQGVLVGKYLASQYPKYATDIMKIANNISRSRLAANVHFPSDSVFGEKIASALYLYMRNTAELNMDKIKE